jgi:hypothetical protein
VDSLSWGKQHLGLRLGGLGIRASNAMEHFFLTCADI